MEVSPCLAPEIDKWEKTECDEVIQNITIDIHVCPISNLAELISLRYILVKVFCIKYKIITISTNNNKILLLIS